MTYNTYQAYTGNGSTRDYAVPFSYDDPSEVRVFVNQNEVGFTFVNPGLVRLTNAPASGSMVTVRRKTDLSEPVVNFIVSKNVLGGPANTQVRQLLKGLQEAADAQSTQGTQGLPGPAGPAGPRGATGPVAAGDRLFDSAAAIKAATIPTEAGGGTVYIQTAGYSTPGDGGGALYARLPSGSYTETPYRFQSEDGAWWYLAPFQEDVNLLQFGAVADNSTDNYAAIVAALDFLADYTDPWGKRAARRLYIPRGRYYCSQTIQLKKAGYHIIGDQTGFQGGPGGTIIRFPAGVGGIVVNRYNTLGGTYTGEGGSDQADGSIIEGIFLLGGGYSATIAHGIRLRARARIISCAIADFSGNGVHISAAAGAFNNQSEGNANCWQMYDCVVVYNGWHGIYTNGPDVNAGTATNCDFSYNGQFGICDESFLGNTYVGCHMDSNALYTQSGVNGDPKQWTSQCNHGGYVWYVVPTGSDSAATTEPGTNSAVWKRGNAYDGTSWPFPAWIMNGAFRQGGAIRAGTSNNQRTVFLGCYTESGQPPAWIESIALTIGGCQAAGNLGNGWVMNDRQLSSFSLADGPTDDAHAGTIFFKNGTNSVMSLVQGLNGSPIELRSYQSDGTWRWEYGSGNFGQILTTDGTTLTQGRSNPIGQNNTIFTKGVFLGGPDGYTSARWLGSYSTTPAIIGSPFATGDFAFNSNPSAGGPIGWQCLSGGTSGTWRAVNEGPLAACLVSQLPSSNRYVGMRGTVTDANATTFLSTVAGGGSNVVPVMWNGSNWVIG